MNPNLALAEAANQIQDLKEEIRYLRGIIQQRADVELQASAQAAFGWSPLTARLAMLLYARAGRIVAKGAIMDALYLDDPDTPEVHIISVLIHRIRDSLGKDAIVTQHGTGYGMTPEGVERLRAVLDKTP